MKIVRQWALIICKTVDSKFWTDMERARRPKKQPQSYMALGATQGHENICLISRRPYGA